MVGESPLIKAVGRNTGAGEKQMIQTDPTEKVAGATEFVEEVSQKERNRESLTLLLFASSSVPSSTYPRWRRTHTWPSY